jgi:hypothetical protein
MMQQQQVGQQQQMGQQQQVVQGQQEQPSTQQMVQGQQPGAGHNQQGTQGPQNLGHIQNMVRSQQIPLPHMVPMQPMGHRQPVPGQVNQHGPQAELGQPTGQVGPGQVMHSEQQGVRPMSHPAILQPHEQQLRLQQQQQQAGPQASVFIFDFT